MAAKKLSISGAHSFISFFSIRESRLIARGVGHLRKKR